MNVSLPIALISGAAGGNFAGGLLKPLNLGLLGNSLFGSIGGYLGLQGAELILGDLTTVSIRDGANASTVVAIILASAGGGALTTIVAGAIRNQMNRS